MDNAAMSAPAGGDARILLGEDVEIYPARRRADLDTGAVIACEAKDRRQTGEQVAYFCGRDTVPRFLHLGTYRQLKNPGILKLLDAGVVQMPQGGGQRFAFVFERPPARRLMASWADKPYKLTEDKIVDALIVPVVSLLSDFKNIDFVHGAINPLSIFFSGAEGAERAVLGECLTSAPSIAQHPFFEPIERAMAGPTGRGPATIKEDLYALGICVALAWRGENFFEGKTEAEVLAAKLDGGTYSLVAEGGRFPSKLAEFLRGTLSDDDLQRWDIEEAVAWLEGRRTASRFPRARVHAARPFVFLDKKHWDLRGVAYAFAQNPAEAVLALEQGQFDLWIKRNFEDKALIKRVEAVWDREKSSGHDRIISTMCMALDPYGPVRYRGLSLFPAGFGVALADAVARGAELQHYAEFLMHQLFSVWVNQRFEEIGDAAGLVSQFEKCRNYLTQKTSGYGIERVVYYLSKEIPCLSPHLKDHYVLTPGRLLLALEEVSRRPDRPEHVLDRHMIAFVSVREPKMIDPFLGYITSREKGSQIIGVLHTLAAIQRKFGIGPMPGVSGWIASLAAPAVDRFYDLDLRHELARQFGRAANGGDLPALLDILDDPLAVRTDADRYALARQEFVLLSREKERIVAHLRQRATFGRATGRQAAMIASALLAALSIFGYAALMLMGKVV